MLHFVACCCVVLRSVAWCCVVLHGVAWLQCGSDFDTVDVVS